MPHFFASTLNDRAYPFSNGDFEFVLEAYLGDFSLILTKYHNRRFFLSKQKRNDTYLIKFNKQLRVPSSHLIKQALKAYASATNAVIVSHNLATKNTPTNNPNPIDKSPYLLTCYNPQIHLDKNFSIEIGFGSGRHILDLARKNPNEIFLGLEVYRPSIMQVLNQIRLLHLTNLFVMYADARILFEILPHNIAQAIYLHFPIPWDKNPQKRVLSEAFLRQSMRILKRDGFLELRSDSKEYVLFGIDIAQKFKDIEIIKDDNRPIISKYEARWLRQEREIFNVSFVNRKSSQNICYNSGLSFTFDSIDISKILESQHLKFHNEEYFLHIKNIYKFDNGYILFVIFGALSSPNSIYLVLNNEYTNQQIYKNIEVLGDIMPTKANINALQKFLQLYGATK